MKKYIMLSIVFFFLWSCSGNQNEGQGDSFDRISDSQKEELTENKSKSSIEEKVKEAAKDGSKENPQNDLMAMAESLFKSSNTKDENNFQFETSTLLDLLEASGVSRAEMEKLMSNPDSLHLLAQEAIKKRAEAKKDAPEKKLKITQEQLSFKKSKNSVSLEEAILMVQAESGPEATLEKLKKIDSLAGTNAMSQLDLTEAGYLLQDVERKNEIKASPDEEAKMKSILDKSGQMHSAKEAREFLTELNQMEDDLVSGKMKGSPRFKRNIELRRKNFVHTQKGIERKSKAAKKKFKQLNPDLYFGDEVGETYFGFQNQAVYLPLGDLSFADEVISANHPQLLIQDVKNVLGAPDKIETFDDAFGIHSLGLNGDLTVRFVDNALTNVNGPDLYIFEIGQIEKTDLEISKDGKQWIKVGKIDGGVAEVDIAPFVKDGDLFYFVRLKDLETESGVPGADVDAIGAIGAAMRLNLDSQVLFETGKSELKTEGISALKKLAESIKVLKKGKVIVEGHTDDVGSADSNKKLSFARAKSVSRALKELIPSEGFSWQEIGYGESKPLMANDSKLNRSKNRRVEVLILPN